MDGRQGKASALDYCSLARRGRVTGLGRCMGCFGFVERAGERKPGLRPRNANTQPLCTAPLHPTLHHCLSVYSLAASSALHASLLASRTLRRHTLAIPQPYSHEPRRDPTPTTPLRADLNHGPSTQLRRGPFPPFESRAVPRSARSSYRASAPSWPPTTTTTIPT